MGCKDIFIGVLLAFLAMDIMFQYLHTPSYPSVFSKFLGNINTQSGLVIAITAVLIGVVMWYLSAKTQTETMKRKDQ